MKEEDLIAGEYYCCRYSGSDYCLIHSNEPVIHAKLNGNYFSANGWRFQIATDSLISIRKASLNERKWLDNCIKNNKATLYVDEIPNNELN